MPLYCLRRFLFPDCSALIVVGAARRKLHHRPACCCGADGTPRPAGLPPSASEGLTLNIRKKHLSIGLKPAPRSSDKTVGHPLQHQTVKVSLGDSPAVCLFQCLWVSGKAAAWTPAGHSTGNPSELFFIHVRRAMFVFSYHCDL